MKTRFLFIVLCSLALATSCGTTSDKKESKAAVEVTEESASPASQTTNTPAQILAKPQVPVLCYHRIEDGKKGDYTVSVATFKEHVKVLADSGFHSVSPAQLYDYLVYNKSLPANPFLITFDDSRVEHNQIAGPVLEKAGFRGVFFIMTITYNKKNYMTTDQIAALAKAGHTIGLHSWDHTMASKYVEPTDWTKQVVEPKAKLEKIVGKPVEYWAYPNGVTNHTASLEMAKHFKIAFILSTKRDSIVPLQTVRRIIVTDCSSKSLLKSMRRNFN